MDPEIQRSIQEVLEQIRELTVVMRNLGNTISATADEQIHRLGTTAKQTSDQVTKTNKILDQYGKEIKASTDVIEDEAKARRDATKATREQEREAIRHQQEAFVYRRRERSAFRDLAQELGTTRGMMNRFQESVLGISDNPKYQAGMLLAGAGLEALGRSASSLARSLYSGEIGIAGIGRAVESFAQELGGAAMALGAASMLLGPFKVMGAVVAAVGLALKTLGSVLGLLTQQANQQVEAFRNLQKVGGALGTTTDEILNSAQKLGLGINELEKFTSLVGQNANTLAMFRGSVAAGAQEFSDLGAVFKRTGLRDQFLNMGMRLEDINEGMLGYLEIQTRNTQIETRTQGQLVKGMQAYLLETNRLAALTGKSRQEQEDQVRGAYAIEQFQYRINQLRQEGTEESIAEADRLTAIFRTISSSGGPGLARAMAEMTTGFVTSSNSIGAFLLTNAEAMRIMRDPTIEAADAVDRLREILGTELTQGALGSLAAFGQFNTVTGQSYEELTRFVNQTRAFGERTRTLSDTQADQIAQGDKLVKQLVSMEEANRNSRDMLQDFINKGVVPATTALAKLAETVERLLRWFVARERPEGVARPAGAVGEMITGFATPRNQVELGRSQRIQQQLENRPGAARAEPGDRGGGLLQRALSGMGFTPGRSGSRVSGVPAGGQAPLSPDQVIQFLGGTSGNRRNFDELEPSFRADLLDMAREYFEQTGGKKLSFGSGQRTKIENDEVGGVANSRHILGTAADLSRVAVSELAKMGLLEAYGFQQNAKSPWHISRDGYRYGGVASGPKSGYTALLHGTEAVVPLPDNRSIPVEMPNFDRSLQAQTDMMSAHLSRLDEVVAVMRNQLDVSQRILQVAQN